MPEVEPDGAKCLYVILHFRQFGYSALLEGRIHRQEGVNACTSMPAHVLHCCTSRKACRKSAHSAGSGVHGRTMTLPDCLHATIHLHCLHSACLRHRRPVCKDVLQLTHIHHLQLTRSFTTGTAIQCGSLCVCSVDLSGVQEVLLYYCFKFRLWPAQGGPAAPVRVQRGPAGLQGHRRRAACAAAAQRQPRGGRPHRRRHQLPASRHRHGRRGRLPVRNARQTVVCGPSCTPPKPPSLTNKCPRMPDSDILCVGIAFAQLQLDRACT